MFTQARKTEMCQNRNVATKEEKLIVEKTISSKKEPMEKVHMKQKWSNAITEIESKRSSAWKKCTLKIKLVRSRKTNESSSRENDVKTMKFF